MLLSPVPLILSSFMKRAFTGMITPTMRNDGVGGVGGESVPRHRALSDLQSSFQNDLIHFVLAHVMNTKLQLLKRWHRRPIRTFKNATLQ